MPKVKENKRYTLEFKIKVVETMQKEKLSYREAAREFEITRSSIEWGLNNKQCNRIMHQKMTKLKMQPKRATLRSDSTQAVR